MLDDEMLEAVQRLRPIAERGRPVDGRSWRSPGCCAATSWPRRSSAPRPEQVHANAEASGVELSGDMLDAIDEALGDVPVTGTTLDPEIGGGVLHRYPAILRFAPVAAKPLSPADRGRRPET